MILRLVGSRDCAGYGGDIHLDTYGYKMVELVALP